MKAKEYISEFERIEKEEGFDKALVKTMMSFYEECGKMSKKRGTSNNSMISIFKEQDAKWRSFAKNDERIKQSGFRDIIMHYFPDIKNKAMW